MENEASDQARRRTLADARRVAAEWGYWCHRGAWGGRTGRKPGIATGTVDRMHEPGQEGRREPRPRVADENLGFKVQRAFYRLPNTSTFPFRRVLDAEFCIRPRLAHSPQDPRDICARYAGVSAGAYERVLELALLALANLMRFDGTWDAVVRWAPAEEGRDPGGAHETGPRARGG